jgi:ubiquinone/menaquinone biosynthesis C-methylase UbiE
LTARAHKHEIHIQPGGYVGDPLGGCVYHYGVNVFTLDLKSEDQFHRDLAAIVPIPSDGKAQRFLDIGTGVAQLPMALKERFPQAEIWGIDVGTPMLRYGHMRAIEQNLEIHLAQRLAEDTKFEDNSFDVVTAYILFHEVPTEHAKKILAEVRRILRPGGVFFPVDFKTYSQTTTSASGRFNQWWDHVYNNEVWAEEYRLTGSIDMIFYRKSDDSYVIYDWKRSKDIKVNNDFGGRALYPLDHLHDTNYWHYSLQLNVYRWFLETYYGLKISDINRGKAAKDAADGK